MQISSIFPLHTIFYFFFNDTAHTNIYTLSLHDALPISINGHIKFNLTIPLQQLNGLETLVIIMVANKYAFLQITRRRFLNEWEAFKKVISKNAYLFATMIMKIGRAVQQECRDRSRMPSS